MNITNPYNPNQGLLVISPAGSQKYTDQINSYSQIFNDVYVSSYNKDNKYCIDSCWESGNIYYANYDEGYVRKIAYDGTILATLNLTNPFMVSVIQNSTGMNVDVTSPPQDDQGCWIADKGTGKIIKTDKNLNILYELNGVTNAICIKSNIDGGCYVVEYHTSPSIGGNLIKLSSTAEIIGIKNYTAFNPAITKFTDLAVDKNGFVWVCADNGLHPLESDITKNERFTTIFPFADNFSSSSSEEDMYLGSIDIDRNTRLVDQFLYVVGGNSYKSVVYKYDRSGNRIIQQEYNDIYFPYVVKVIQGMGSDSIYLLSDSSKWDDFGYGSSSSSSSSSSTEIRSSSSSSSSSTEIRSSSSSN